MKSQIDLLMKSKQALEAAIEQGNDHSIEQNVCIQQKMQETEELKKMISDLQNSLKDKQDQISKLD